MARRRNSGRSSRRSRSSSGPRRMSRHLEGVKDIDPSNYELVQRFVTEHGKIIPARLTGASAKQQRQIKRAVRRARVMGLVP